MPAARRQTPIWQAHRGGRRAACARGGRPARQPGDTAPGDRPAERTALRPTAHLRQRRQPRALVGRSPRFFHVDGNACRQRIANGTAGLADGCSPMPEPGIEHSGIACLIRANQARDGVGPLALAPALDFIGHVGQPGRLAHAHPDRAVGYSDQLLAKHKCRCTLAYGEHQRCIAANVSRQRIQRRVDSLQDGARSPEAGMHTPRRGNAGCKRQQDDDPCQQQVPGLRPGRAESQPGERERRDPAEKRAIRIAGHESPFSHRAGRSTQPAIGPAQNRSEPHRPGRCPPRPVATVLAIRVAARW